MNRIRSLLASMVLLAMLLVGCGSPAAPPPTYSAEQLSRIAQYANEIEAYRDRFEALQTEIEQRDWIEVDKTLHGPLGTLRQTMFFLTRELLPAAQPAAQGYAKELFRNLEQIDAADDAGDYDLAITNYREAIQDYKAYLDLVPKAESEDAA